MNILHAKQAPLEEKLLILENQMSLHEQGSLLWKKFKSKGFPHKKDPQWRHTNLSPLTESSFIMVPKVTMPQEHTIVMVDGSPSFFEHSEQFSVSLEEVNFSVNNKSISDEDSFSLFHRAMNSKAMVIRVPNKIVVNRPIHIIWTTSEQVADGVTFPALELHLGEESECSVIESFVSNSAKSYFNNPLSLLHAHRGSKLYYYREQNEGEHASHIGYTYLDVRSDAFVSSFIFSKGAKLSRHTLFSSLHHLGSEVYLAGLALHAKEQQGDHYLALEHHSPHTKSEQFYKGIYSGSAHGVFAGKVMVKPGAMPIVSYQQNQNLLLSPDAHVDSKPELEINADDVKCSHGSTVGRMSAEELLYLQSRGLSSERAHLLLVKAFASEVIKRSVREEELQEHFFHQITEFMKKEKSCEVT
ncbi:MAG: Fe-S cluster assembly protein SufD [Oligoflexia bacterium]|nr:Fe-S cluster assembly protein SufD [Oligoflexia bacterium]